LHGTIAPRRVAQHRTKTKRKDGQALRPARVAFALPGVTGACVGSSWLPVDHLARGELVRFVATMREAVPALVEGRE